MIFRKRLLAALFVILVTVEGFASEPGLSEPFTVEYYYKIKWGYQDEWLKLYKKNHWPILLAEMKNGYILNLQVHEPQNSSRESDRWDLRVTITFKNVLVPHGLTDRAIKRKALIKEFFPDGEAYDREEQRRFQLLDALWDTELVAVPTSKWPTDE